MQTIISNKIKRIVFSKESMVSGLTNREASFLETNKIILDKFGTVKSMLEIGCGEGFQSYYLQQVCEKLIGVDVSKFAVDRAQKKLPKSKFVVGDISSIIRTINVDAPFDLIVACEVIYYMTDIPKALQQIWNLSKNRFITYYEKKRQLVDPHILNLPGSRVGSIDCGEFRWCVVWSKQSY